MKHTRRQIEEAIKYWTRYLNESLADDIEDFRKNPRGQSAIPGTIPYLLRQNMDRFNDRMSKDDILDMCNSIFYHEKVDPGQLKWFLSTLKSIYNRGTQFDMLLFIGNVYQNGCGFSMNMNRGYGDDKERADAMDAEREEVQKNKLTRALGVIAANIDQLEDCLTVTQIVVKCKKMFDDADLDVDKMKGFFNVLQKKRTLNAAIDFIYEMLEKAKIKVPMSKKPKKPEVVQTVKMDDVFPTNGK